MLIGRKAIEAYVEGTPGRLMRGLKSVLGTLLIDTPSAVTMPRRSDVRASSRRYSELPWYLS